MAPKPKSKARKIKFTHWMSTEAFWVMVSRQSHKYPAGIKPFDPQADWAGPANNPRLAEMIPERILGIYIGDAAFRHDYGYAVGGGRLTRWIDDTVFRRECMEAVALAYEVGELASEEFLLAKKFCWLYYGAVRLGGRKCYNYHGKKGAKA